MFFISRRISINLFSELSEQVNEMILLNEMFGVLYLLCMILFFLLYHKDNKKNKKVNDFL